MEFALEDARIVKVREERKKRREHALEAKIEGPQNKRVINEGVRIEGAQNKGVMNEGVRIEGAQKSGEQRVNERGGEANKKLSRKVDWQLKCRAKRLRRRERERQTDSLTHSSQPAGSEGRSATKRERGKRSEVAGRAVTRQKERKVFSGPGKSVASESKRNLESFVGGGEGFVEKRKRKLTSDEDTELFSGDKRVKLSKKHSRQVRLYF